MRPLITVLTALTLASCSSVEEKPYEPNTLAFDLQALSYEVVCLAEAEDSMKRYLTSLAGGELTPSQVKGLEAYTLGCESIREGMLEEIEDTLKLVDLEFIEDAQAVERVVIMFEDRLIKYMAQFSHPAVPQDTAWSYIAPRLQKLKQALQRVADHGGVAQG